MVQQNYTVELSAHDKQFQAVMQHTRYKTHWDDSSGQLVATVRQSDIGALALAIKIPLDVVSRRGGLANVAPRRTLFKTSARSLMPQISLALYQRRPLKWIAVADGCIHFLDEETPTRIIKIPLLTEEDAYAVRAKNGQKIILRDDWAYEIDGRDDDFCIYVGRIGLSVQEVKESVFAVAEIFSLN